MAIIITPQNILIKMNESKKAILMTTLKATSSPITSQRRKGLKIDL
jgi:hypothetical protein